MSAEGERSSLAYEIIEAKDHIRLVGGEKFSPVHTFECGQCFRWMPSSKGGYVGVAGGRAARIWSEGEDFCISGSAEDYEDFWRRYLDLDRDYGEIASAFTDDFTRRAVDYGMGLRILRQEPWEALCSFIISQCNNIPRIQKIVGALCSAYGDAIEFEGERYMTFPSAERIAMLPEGGLDMLRAGYRAPYILSAAREVAEGRVDFDALDRMATSDAEKAIMQLNGVGRKVADCFLLFGLGKLDAFPVDTWMKKAAPYYKGAFDKGAFGNFAGIAQQYIFYFVRSTKFEN